MRISTHYASTFLRKDTHSAVFLVAYESGMDKMTPEKLGKMIEDAGTNPAALALDIGRDKDYIRDFLVRRKKSLKADDLALILSRIEKPAKRADHDAGEIPVVGLEVVSEVQAGNWLEVTTLDDSYEHPIIPVARDPRFPRARQYALKVRGDSMDNDYPDGSYVTCVDYWDAGVPLRDGLHVHVERQRAGGQLVEITVKAIERAEGKLWLAPRSSNPKWTRVPVDSDKTVEVIVKGIVTGGWRPTEI